MIEFNCWIAVLTMLCTFTSLDLMDISGNSSILSPYCSREDTPHYNSNMKAPLRRMSKEYVRAEPGSNMSLSVNRRP